MNEAYPALVETATIPPVTSPRLLDQVRGVLRAKHYSYRTEQAYANWIRRFVLFHGKRHPREMGTAEIDVVAYRPKQRACVPKTDAISVGDSAHLCARYAHSKRL